LFVCRGKHVVHVKEASLTFVLSAIDHTGSGRSHIQKHCYLLAE
jgi:hypothetical protein